MSSGTPDIYKNFVGTSKRFTDPKSMQQDIQIGQLYNLFHLNLIILSLGY